MSNGTLVLNANGSFSYTPDANYTGGDSFGSYGDRRRQRREQHGHGDADGESGDRPTVTDESFSTNEDTVLNADVSTNDSTTSGGA